jgi:hypothetical protein
VSPRTWDSSDPKNKLEDWLAACKANSSWKDIWFIDGVVLETWLERRPAVAAWHARRTLGVAPQEGVRSTDEFWQDFAGQFDPMLTEEVLLCERDDVAQQLTQNLLQPSNIVSLVADSPDEVVAFAIAAIRKAAKDVRRFLEVRTLVVDNAAAGRQLLARDNLVLLLRDDAARSPAQFSAVGAILVPHGRPQKPDRAQILARPSGFGLGRAMVSITSPHNQPQLGLTVHCRKMRSGSFRRGRKGGCTASVLKLMGASRRLSELRHSSACRGRRRFLRRKL